jgi:hypothetical protein
MMRMDHPACRRLQPTRDDVDVLMFVELAVCLIVGAASPAAA